MDGVQPDDEGYPGAPVPPHERVWRHPSEIGEASWQRTEPPLTIGRGLLVTTGAIGGLLAIAVLWAMLPTAAGGGPNALSTEPLRTIRQAVSSVRDTGGGSTDTATLAAPMPSTTIRRSTAATTVRPSGASASTGATDAADDGTDAAPGTGSNAGPATSLRSTSTDDSTPTAASTTGGNGTSSILENVPRATITVTGTDGPTTAIAVAVGGVPVVLTTASAVQGATGSVTLSFDDGRTADAKVAMTVGGIAMLTTDDTAAAAATFRIASTPHDGDSVTLLGATPATVALRVDDDGALWLQSWGDGVVAEGTPVVDDQGKVVALCSKGSAGPKLVTVDQRTLRSALDSATKPYLGVYLNADPSGSLTVNAVDPNGPAATIGVVAGDTIVAIDGRALGSSDDLYDVLSGHAPDDAVSITLRHADGSEVSADLVLAVSPTRA